ncbi:MAG TPA: hypothetical protein VFD86_05730 [Nitrospira sp.]|nr:hypothetical protein [Nitrospira sp.]
MTRVALMVLLFTLDGCIDIATRLQPEDASVNEALYGEDCIPTFFGFGFGTATIERAMADVGPDKDFSTHDVNGVHISKVRRVELHDFQVLSFGNRCVEVVGE